MRSINTKRIFHFEIEESSDRQTQFLVITLDNDRGIKCKLPSEIYSEIGQKHWSEFKRVFMHSLSNFLVCNCAIIDVDSMFKYECDRFLRKPLDN